MPARRPTAALPMRFEPQLASLVKTAPDGDDWLHEIKFDGYRIGARVERGAVTLVTRAGNDWTTSFPEVRDAVAALPATQALLDGEVAAVLPDGRTSFQALQRWFSGGKGEIVYYVFDLLHLDGEDVASLPLEERKARLEALLRSLPKHSLIRYSSHVVGGGRRFFAAACERGLEGIVSKRRTRPYEPGRRGGWTKSKCLQRQELVIGGFTDPEGARTGLGALLLGVYDETGALRFAGKTGTGFTQRSADELRKRLERLARATSPFADPPREWKRWRSHWVEPTLVAEVAFSEWTDDGRLRQSSFQGLREDKPAHEVVRERSVPVASVEGRRRRADEPAHEVVRERSVPVASVEGRRRRADKPAHEVVRERSVPVASVEGRRRGADKPAREVVRERASTVVSVPKVKAPPPKGTVELEGVRLTHPERVLYPIEKLTKLELARFYEEVGEWILPHLAGRPLSLVRCPTGLGSCFYVKHATTADPDVLRRIPIREKEKTREYVVAEGLPGVMALVQMSVLEIHTWNCVADDLERPNRVIIDLDPGPEVQWPQVLEAAELVRTAFATLGLESFVKTTGGKGLHVVVPLVPERELGHLLRVRARRRGVHRAPASEGLHDRDAEGGPREEDPARPLPESPRQHGRRGVLDPGPRRRAGLGAARLGRALPEAPVGSFHRRESAAAPAALEARSLACVLDAPPAHHREGARGRDRMTIAA